MISKKYSFFDWIWFIFYLRCNEHSGKINLNLDKKYASDKEKNEASYQVVLKRNKAHEMDIIWSNLKLKARKLLKL